MGNPLPLSLLDDEVRSPTLTPRQRWIDLCFVIGVTLCQPIISSTVIALHPEMLRFAGTGAQVLQGILMCLSGLGVLLYVLWKRGTTIDMFGARPHGTDIFRGMLLFVAAYLVIGIAAVTYSATYRHFAGREPTEIKIASLYASRFQILTLVFIFINPWYEELVVRGFLMTELSQLTNMTVAVIASTVIQASYHTYEGSWNLVQIVPTLLLFSIYYARTRRLFPLIVAHTLLDYAPMLWYALRHRIH